MKALYIKKSIVLITVIAAVTLLIISMSNAVPTYKNQTKPANKPIYCVDTDDKRVAISFDAAWGADKTAEIMDIVENHNSRATFFLVGFWVEKYPDLVREIDRRGHEIGNHSSTHPQMSKLSREQIMMEIKTTNDKIRQLTGRTPEVFRPPFGDYSDTLVKTVREMGMHAIQWDVDSLDWKELGVEHMVNTVMKKVKNGSIILFHNNAKYITEALPIILDKLHEKGYQTVPVSDLIMKENYYVDIAGIQRGN
ncbi:MAG TPA: polysaccharide deacetylase family protein [Clostridia bacterium]|nr:polysaccharide deacetylase family protein [Clostridia bacterium]